MPDPVAERTGRETAEQAEVVVTTNPVAVLPASRRWLGALAKVSDRLLPKQQSSAPILHAKLRSGGEKYLLSFALFVAVPATAATLYFAFLASNQYTAEARFAVINSRYDLSSDKIDKLKSALTGGGGGIASQDAYLVGAYIQSRAAIDDISRGLNLRQMFRQPEADFWARLKDKASAEELTTYWRSMVSAYVDAPSGIVTVTVQAFRPEDALAICRALVTSSESLANAVSARSQQYTIRVAESEMDKSERRVGASLADMKAFREKEGLIDPSSEAKQTASVLTTLLSQRMQLENQYSVSSQSMSSEAPTVQALKLHLDILDKQIADERAKLTGVDPQNATIASILPKFEELEVRSRFAQKVYELAGEGLERARVRAEAQAIYVEAFVPPELPEDLYTRDDFGPL